MTGKRGSLVRKKGISLILALVLLSAGSVWGEEAGEEIPAVPATIMAAIDKINRGKRNPKRGSGLATVRESEQVEVRPGENVILPVSEGHLNRLVTPFEHPVVHTTSKSKTVVEGSVIYVSLVPDDGPMTMFVTEEGEQDPAISLTLKPEAIPPREIRLTLSGGGTRAAMSPGGKAAKWEQSQPYVEAIEKILLSTARGQVPQGYNLRHPLNYDPAPRSRGVLKVEPRQVLEGHNFLVVVSILTNISSDSVLVDEALFYRPGVRAVAVWPQVRLRSKEKTELYVVYQRDFGRAPRVRPSVLTDANEVEPRAERRTARRRTRPEAESPVEDQFLP